MKRFLFLLCLLLVLTACDWTWWHPNPTSPSMPHQDTSRAVEATPTAEVPATLLPTDVPPEVFGLQQSPADSAEPLCITDDEGSCATATPFYCYPAPGPDVPGYPFTCGFCNLPPCGI